jgi:predicted acylesterase/phospholipase RssA
MAQSGTGEGSARKLGLVLSGGGARGAFQVGVYERLLRDPRFSDGPAVVSGTSAGAINAALIAAGKSPRDVAIQIFESNLKKALGSRNSASSRCCRTPFKYLYFSASVPQTTQ